MSNDITSRLDTIDARLSAIEELLQRDTGEPTDRSDVARHQQRPLSITEYVLEKKPTDDNQRALVLADYLETQKGQDGFTSDELRQAFVDSRLRVPSNVSDKIGKSVQKGHLMPYGEREGKKAWRLTMTGQRVVEEGFGE